jgi:membrane protease YdiL (CAAX protease family)
MKHLPLLFTLACLALLVPRWWKHRGAWRGDLGLGPHPRKALDFAAGAALGLLAMLAIFGVEWACGWLRPGPFDPSGLGNLDVLPAMAVVAFWEELRFRGVELSGLRSLLPTWAALALSSAAFGAAHALNANASWLSIAGNAVDGLVYGYAFLASGAIWLPAGLHAAWNIVQGPVLGLPVSGYVEGGLWHPAVSGPSLLTGGAYGPEAGLLGLASRFLILALLVATLRTRRSNPLRGSAAKELPC